MTARTSVMSPITNYSSNKYVPSTRRRSPAIGSTYNSSYSSSYSSTAHRPPAYPTTNRTSSYTSDVSSRYATSSRKTGSTTSLRTVTSPRPLPSGRGPLDEHGRKIGINDIVSGRTTGTSSRYTPGKSTYGSSTYTTTHTLGGTGTTSPGAAHRDSSLPRSRFTRAGSVSDIRATFENLNVNSNHNSTTSSSLSRSKRFGSHADLSSSSNNSTPRANNSITPERTREDLLYDTGGASRHVTKNYYNTSSHTYDYKSRENGIDSLPDIRRPVGQSSRSITRSPSTDRTRRDESPITTAGNHSNSSNNRRSSLTRQNSIGTTSPQHSSVSGCARCSTAGCPICAGYPSRSSGSCSSCSSPSCASASPPCCASAVHSPTSCTPPVAHSSRFSPSCKHSHHHHHSSSPSKHQHHLQHSSLSRSSPESSLTSSTSSMTSRGLVGLRNMGNTCFMNSILQCLSNTRLLLEYCLNDEYTTDINKSTSNMKGALINAYAKLMKTMWKQSGDSYLSPTEFKSQIQKFAPRFVGYNQQDSQEFLIYLLEGLHEDVNRVTEKKKQVIKEDEGEEKISASEKARETWKRYLCRENSRVVDMFVGQLKSCLRCTSCGYASNTFDPLWQLSLPIKKRGVSDVSLQDCLDLFTHEEVMDGDEKPTCARCKQRRKCTKSFSIQKFPKLLIIHLKRFNHESLFRSKLSTNVDFPLTDLDLSKYAADKGGSPILYNLYAVSNHSGTPLSGHYTACAKHPYSGDWHMFNDQRVSSISASRVQSSEGYVLFYELSNQSARL